MAISALKRKWHLFWRNYNLLLIESCLDDKMIQELKRKVEYHEKKLSAL